MENTYSLPDYYAGYTDRKIGEIPAGKSFVFITDSHWTTNTGHSPELIRYVRDHAPIQKVIFGGDYLDRYESREEAIECIHGFTDPCVAAFGADYLPVIGNHDTNMANALLAYPDSPEQWERMAVSYKDIDDLTLAQLRGVAHPMEAEEKITRYTQEAAVLEEMRHYLKGVYYVDDDRNRVRYIVVNTTSAPCYGKLYDTFGFSFNHELPIQVDWLAETLMTTPEGYDVVIAGHMFAVFEKPSRNIYLRREVAIIAAFVRRMKYTFKIIDMPEQIKDWYPSLERQYDFTAAPKIGRLVCLTGDQHTDGTFAVTLNEETGRPRGEYYDGTPIDVKNGWFPMLMTSTDSVHNAQWAPFPDMIVPMEKGTVTEQLFDVVTLRDNGIVCTRFGAGKSREVLVNW